MDWITLAANATADASLNGNTEVILAILALVGTAFATLFGTRKITRTRTARKLSAGVEIEDPEDENVRIRVDFGQIYRKQIQQGQQLKDIAPILNIINEKISCIDRKITEMRVDTAKYRAKNDMETERLGERLERLEQPVIEYMGLRDSD